MFYAYVLESEKDGRFYYGSTSNIEDRLARHNSGKVTATKHRLPMKLIGYIEYESRLDAEKQERYFKRCRNSCFVKKLLNQYGAIV